MTAHLPKKLEHIATEDLLPYARNSRTHSPAQIDAVARSITAYGFTNPVLIRGQTIIAGHGRVMAAKQIGLEKVPAIRLDHLSESEARAYVIADNRLAELAGWDDAVLADELRLLKQDGLDLALTGWEGKELDELMFEPTVPKTDPDATPPVQEVARSQRGDVWTLGLHRIMCGDSTSKTAVDVLMAGKNAALCLTDPPYGLGETASGKNEYIDYVDSSENLKSTISGFMPLALEICKAVVLTPGNKHQRLYPVPNWTMAWFTPAGVGCGPWGWCCWQPILCYGTDPKLSKGKGRHPDAIVHTESSEKNGHPCSKPIKFWCWLMERTSELAELIYEPFSGSGTTIIAAEQTGRQCYAMELSPNYVDVAVRRWQAYTGQRAIHAVTGQPFGD